jgi:CubicO group peptidase (beta-lactamase class C family)
MKLKKVSLLIIAVSVLIYGIPTASAKDKDQFDLKGFGKYVEQVMKDWKVPGMAICVVKNGKMVLAEGYGYRDVAGKQKVTPNTLFAIGSSSKAFTATLVGMLVDQGKLDWNKKVRDYIPSFKLYDDYASENMNLVDLMCHRSGLPRHDLSWYGSTSKREDLFKRIQYFKPSAGFRAVWQYQNFMFMTAGYLVGAVLDTTWENALKTMLLEPLGMNATNTSVEDMKKAADYALPYRENKNKQVEAVPFRNIDEMGPAGSINSNIIDMSKWLMLNLEKGKIGEKQIISESALSMLHTPQMLIQSSRAMDLISPNSIMAYGLGWFIITYQDHLIIHHGGNIDGFSAFVTFAPKDNTGIVVLTNMDSNPAGMIVAFNIYDRLLGLPQKDLNKTAKDFFEKAKAEAEKQQKEKDKDRKLNTAPSHPLEDYAGEYGNPGYDSLTLKIKDGKLIGNYNGIEMTGEHYHYDVFTFSNELLDEPMKIAFFSDLKGNINTFEIPIEPSIEPLRFERLPEKTMQEKKFLEKFAGKYELMGIVVTITLRGETSLFANVPGQPDYELVPYKGMEFNLKNLTGYSVEFTEENGKVTKLTFKQPNGNFEAKRVE